MLQDMTRPDREQRVVGCRCGVAIFHPSRRGPDGTLEGHLEGGAPAVLPGPETLDGDPYPAPLLVSVVLDGPMLFVSRRVAALQKELFVQRFPAIARGDVDVYAVAREPGVRAKIALDSDSLDPDFIQRLVGDGAALRQIVVDAGDPIIDLISTDPDPSRYACAALAPTQIVRLGVHESSRELALMIPDDEDLEGVHFQLARDLVRWSIVVCRASFATLDTRPRCVVKRRPPTGGRDGGNLATGCGGLCRAAEGPAARRGLGTVDNLEGRSAAHVAAGLHEATDRGIMRPLDSHYFARSASMCAVAASSMSPRGT